MVAGKVRQSDIALQNFRLTDYKKMSLVADYGAGSDTDSNSETEDHQAKVSVSQIYF